MRRSISWLPGNGTSWSVRQRVDVWRVRAERQPDAAPARVLAQLQQQLARPRGAVDLQDVVERIQPLVGFNGLEIGDVVGGDISH